MQRVICDTIEDVVERFKNDPIFVDSALPMSIANNETRYWCNQAYASILGYSIEDMMKLTYLDLLVPEQRMVLIKNLEDNYGNKIGDASKIVLENRFIKKNGEEIDLLVHITPIFNLAGQAIAGWVVLLDNAQEKSHKRDLEVFKNHFSQLLESLNLIGLSLDREGCIKDINKGGANLIGWDRTELIGKNWFDTCIPLDKRSDLKEFYVNAVDQGSEVPKDFIGEILCRNGKTLSVNWKGTYTKDHHGNINGSISVGEDISEKIILQEEKDKLIQNLVSVSRHESIAQLVGGVAHEFNNVLSIILGFNKLALKSVGSDDEVKLTSYMLEVDKAGKRAAKLIEQLQAYSQRNNSQLKKIELHKEVEDIVYLAKSFFPATIQFQVEKSTKKSIINTDLSLLHQSLMNLMINAQEAMKNKGQITLKITQEKVQGFTCDSCHENFAGDFYVISVENSGEKIPFKVKEKIFDPFFSTKPVGQGTGMGLSVVHGYVHSSLGHIIVKNLDSGGVAFKLYLPINKDYIEDETESKKMLQNSKKILVVDDEETLLFLYGRILKNLGLEADCFHDPLDALENFSKEPLAYSLVITDQTMPGLLGVDLLKKAKDLNPNIHSILISGYSDVVDRNKNSIVDEYYVKPVDVSILISKIKNLFSID
ncbi:MAG: hypothetical protein OHK0056_03470 [Bacteriovoracaceae bacterium]